MKALLLLKTLSPITHGAETAGNESMIRREAVNTPVGVRYVPVLTGNSLRHRLIREPIAAAIAQNTTFSKEQLRWLFNGGALAGANHAIDLRRIERARMLLPHIELLGCSMPDTIVSGKLEMGVGWLMCAESQPVVEALLPASWGPLPRLSPSSEFLSRNQYYRHDAAKQRSELLENGDKDDPGYAGMPHGGEHVIPGATFLVEIIAAGLSELGRSAVIFAIEEWVASGATVGGQSSRGHGVVEPWLWTDGDDSSVLFRSHLEERGDAMRQFVKGLYVGAASVSEREGDGTPGDADRGAGSTTSRRAAGTRARAKS